MLQSLHCSYACYYALICLLYQQQQLAASITIIIDGATTNEWATRDEYQRLVEAGGPLGLAQAGAINDNSMIGAAGGGGGGSDLLAPAGYPGASYQFDDRSASSGAARRPLGLQSSLSSPISSSSVSSSNLEKSQQRAQPQVADERRAIDELDLALDRLDLIEQQQQQLQLQNRLKEHQLVTGTGRGETLAVVSSNQQQQPTVDGQHSVSGSSQLPLAFIDGDLLASSSNIKANLIRPGGHAGRTLSDLVPQGDDDIEDPLRRLKERGSARKYCGHELIDLLELVCQGRYYGVDIEPQIVNPIIKSKRFVSYPEEQQPVVSRRRKLRTLPPNDQLDGRTGSDNNNNNNLDGQITVSGTQLGGSTNNNPHRHQYLSPTRPQQNDNLIDQNVRNKHSQMSKYRRIRGAHKECCERSCHADELKAYCKP